MIRILRWFGIAVVAVLGIPAATLAVVMALGIPISLESFRADIIAAVEQALGREVEIVGPLTLVPALRPTVVVQNIRVANPSDWKRKDFLRLDRAGVQLALLPLLGRKISIDRITIEGGQVQLETKTNGDVNWVFDAGPSEAPGAVAAAPPFELVRLGELGLRALIVTYYDESSGEMYELEIEAVEGSAGRDDRIELSAKGLAQKQPFSFLVTGDSLASLNEPTEPWTFEATGKMAGAGLKVSGSIAEPLRGQGLDLALAINGERLKELESLTKSPLPPVGTYAVKAQVMQTETGYRVSDLEGSMGNTTFKGNFVFDGLASQSRVSGSLDIATLDLNPFLVDASQLSTDKSENAGAAPKRKVQITSVDAGIGEVAFSLRPLRRFDADLELTVGRLMGARADVRDASLRVKIDDGRLTAPITINIADLSSEGQLSVHYVDDSLGFVLALSAHASDIGNLAKVIMNTEDIEGSFEDLTLRVSGRGGNRNAVFESLDVRMTMSGAKLSYGHESGDTPVRFTLEKAEIVMPEGEAMRVTATGTLFDEALSVDLKGGAASKVLAKKPWPIHVRASGAGARLSLRGTVAGPEHPAGTTLDLELSGKKIGDLAVWTGISSNADVAYRATGTLSVKEGEVRLDSLRAKLGRTSLTGDLGANWTDEGLLVSARMQFETIDPAELGVVFSQQDETKPPDDEPGLTLDMPILPHGVKIVDADLDFTADRVRLQPVDVTNMVFKGRIREGRLKMSPFEARLANVSFKGNLSLDLRGQEPVAMLNVSSEHVDVGHLLREFQIVERSEMKARRLSVDLTLRGSELRTIMEKSEVTMVLEDGVTIVRDPNSQSSLEIRIVKSTLSSIPGKPTAYEIDGRIETIPVKIRIETHPLASFIEATGRLPLRLTANAAGVRVEMSTIATPPFTLRDLAVDLSVKGERLDSLDELLDVSLPPWGPYALDGRFQLDQTGYHARELAVQIGGSHLNGDVSLNTTGARPRWAVNLVANTLQLNDFDTGGWSAFQSGGSVEIPATNEDPSASRWRKKSKVEAVFTADSMQQLNARLSVVVNEVLSGKDRLGSGQLVASLEDGRFSLDPVKLNIPGGSIDMVIAFEMTEDEVASKTKVKIEHLNYGVLARWLDPDAEPDGWLALELDLQSRSESLRTMLVGARGYLGFAVWPKNMQADVFDVWVANLVLAILPIIDSGSGSKVNCVVGRFDITDGIMKPDGVLIDTTNMQVSADGTVNFKTRQIDFVLAPRAKKPRMFSLATPVQIRGSYTGFTVGLTPADLLGSAARFVASVVVVPFQRLFGTNGAADGEAACLAAMERPSKS